MCYKNRKMVLFSSGKDQFERKWPSPKARTLTDQKQNDNTGSVSVLEPYYKYNDCDYNNTCI